MIKAKITLQVLIICLISISFATPAIANPSGIPGNQFPGTCAAKMADVPKGDAYPDESYNGKSYVFSPDYKNSVSAWQTANLTSITIANKSKNHLGLPIYVHKDAATAFTNFGKDLLNCEELKQGLYSIEIYDDFACRLITGGKILSPHASGYAVDFNVKTNKYHTGQCGASDCDFSPCFLAALKKNGLSWGGPGDPILFANTCDTQHIQWANNGKSNIRESDLNFCATKSEIAKLYGAGTTLPTGETVGSVTVDTGIPFINEVDLILQKPQTKITLPGLNFSDIKATEENGGKFLYIPFLGEYMAAAYKYGVAIASIFAVVMIINAGFGIAMSGGSPEKINHSKTRIAQSLVGLFLAVGSYTLLYTINPNLVKFKSLKIPHTEGTPITEIIPTYAEGEFSVLSQTNTNLFGGLKPKAKDKCILDSYLPGMNIGDSLEGKTVNLYLFGLDKFWNKSNTSLPQWPTDKMSGWDTKQAAKNKQRNSSAIKKGGFSAIVTKGEPSTAWKKVSDEILASSDLEIKGFLQYMWDYADGKVPALSGGWGPDGVISTFLGTGIGIRRGGANKGNVVSTLAEDFHSLGLAVDIMTNSNNDIGESKKSHAAKDICSKYKATLDKLKSGFYGDYFKGDPYHMYPRLEKKLTACFNRFNNGTDPFTSFPSGWIKIFEKNGFYWGGNGWGNRFRSDGMHFEYWGKCLEVGK